LQISCKADPDLPQGLPREQQPAHWLAARRRVIAAIESRTGPAIARTTAAIAAKTATSRRTTDKIAFRIAATDNPRESLTVEKTDPTSRKDDPNAAANAKSNSETERTRFETS
jgi:hypothetical protein